MKKFISFCKKPLMISACTVFAVALVFMIVILSMSHGSFYVGENKTDKDIIWKYELELNGDELTFTTYQNGELAEVYTNKYKVKDGQLLEYQNADTYTSFFGFNINSLKAFPDEKIGEFDVELKCIANNVILIISIVLMSLSLIAFAFSLYLIIKGKKVSSKKAKK